MQGSAQRLSTLLVCGCITATEIFCMVLQDLAGQPLLKGLLLEYQTAPILNLLPEDRTVWVRLAALFCPRQS